MRVVAEALGPVVEVQRGNAEALNRRHVADCVERGGKTTWAAAGRRGEGRGGLLSGEPEPRQGRRRHVQKAAAMEAEEQRWAHVEAGRDRPTDGP